MTASSNLTAPSVMPAHEHARDWEIEEDLERLLAGMLALLCLALIAAYALEAFLHRRGVWWLPGSGATILLGVLLGCALLIAAGGEAHDMVEFESTIFALVLLPIIIFEAGYSITKCARAPRAPRASRSPPFFSADARGRRAQRTCSRTCRRF